jgi:hypothetical protein
MSDTSPQGAAKRTSADDCRPASIWNDKVWR